MPTADARVGAPAVAPAVEFTPRTKPAIRPTATARATAPVFICRGIFCIPASSPDLADNSKLGFGNRTTRRTRRNGSGAPYCTLVPYSFEPTRTNGSGRTQTWPRHRAGSRGQPGQGNLSAQAAHAEDAGDAGGPAELSPPDSTRRADPFAAADPGCSRPPPARPGPAIRNPAPEFTRWIEVKRLEF